MKLKRYSSLSTKVLSALAVILMGAAIVGNPSEVFAENNTNLLNCVIADNEVTSEKLKELKISLDKKGRDFNPKDYMDKLLIELENAKKESNINNLVVSIELISKVINNSGDVALANDFIEYLKATNKVFNTDDLSAFFNLHLMKMSRLIGDDESAAKYLKEGVSLAKAAKNVHLECELYYASAMADVVDLRMNTDAFNNLNTAIKLSKNKEDFPKKDIIKYYILQSQLHLYFKKDASTASELLGEALVMSQDSKLPDLEIRVKELQTATYPFFFKYEEGINYLKPLVEERIKNGQYLEAVLDLDKLINMYFDNGMYEDGLKLGDKLKETIEKVENPMYKEYFKDYILTLYTANETCINGSCQGAIDVLKSKDFSKYDNFVSIDQSVINLYLGNLYMSIGDNESALTSLQAMLEALKNNSDNNEYVYSDTSMALASAYAALGRYEEAYTTLSKHLDVYIGHNISMNAAESEKLHKMYDYERQQRATLQTRVFVITTASLGIIICLALFDIYRSRKYNKVLAGLSVTDSLTGLSNRRVLDEFLNQRAYLLEKFSSKSDNVYVSAIMLDIDNFKKYNDNYGHVAGDKVLEKVGAVLKDYMFCDTDIVARYGGEEFTVMLMDHDIEKAKAVAEQIRVAVEELNITHEYSTCKKIVTTSIGISTKNILDEDFEGIITEADKALYQSKNSGRNKVTHFEDVK